MSKRLPVCKTMCSTCPFKEGSKYSELKPMLLMSALSEASRICHSTGSNAIKKRTGKKEKLCRGARDIQIAYMHAQGFLSAPTDKAWEDKCKEMNL